MGMFSRFQRYDGRIIQTRCGNDLLNLYKIGDSVPFYVNPEKMGSAEFADDVYDGLCENEYGYEQYWVVIKDSKVEAILHQDEVKFEPDEDTDESFYIQTYNFLKKQYKINQTLYSDECLKKEQERQDALDAERELQVKQYKEQGMSDEQILTEFLIAPISVSVNYGDIASKILVKD